MATRPVIRVRREKPQATTVSYSGFDFGSENPAPYYVCEGNLKAHEVHVQMSDVVGLKMPDAHGSHDEFLMNWIDADQWATTRPNSSRVPPQYRESNTASSTGFGNAWSASRIRRIRGIRAT